MSDSLKKQNKDKEARGISEVTSRIRGLIFFWAIPEISMNLFVGLIN